MQISTEGIVVRRIKYGESGSIVHIFTRSEGMRHFIVKGSKRGSNGALYFPLTQLEFVMTSGKENALGYLKDVRISCPYRNFYQDVKKSTVAIFLAEVLSHVLQHEAQNTPLFDFMKQTLQEFDLAQNNPDFHILFLLDITEYLGFCPQRNGGNNTDGGSSSGGSNSGVPSTSYFDLQDGCFCTERPLHNNYFEGNKAQLFSNLVHRREVGERLPLLEALLLYYKVHTGIGDNIHSLSVLHEVFFDIARFA
ncbi:MAG: DNA repair protein RecO [Bacteroidales bacterium]|jgi:DNA repair protein RecO (recombination protein O)|nr:DNA repair protein RecO [Bacteroidales bacterium]